MEDGKVNRRKNWHQPCATRWFLSNNPSEMRKHVLARDKLICRNCGTQCTDASQMEADHEKCLFEAHGDMSYYEEENVVALCLKCHKEKTRTDMELYRRAYA